MLKLPFLVVTTGVEVRTVVIQHELNLDSFQHSGQHQNNVTTHTIDKYKPPDSKNTKIQSTVKRYARSQSRIVNDSTIY